MHELDVTANLLLMIARGDVYLFGHSFLVRLHDGELYPMTDAFGFLAAAYRAHEENLITWSEERPTDAPVPVALTEVGRERLN